MISKRLSAHQIIDEHSNRNDLNRDSDEILPLGDTSAKIIGQSWKIVSSVCDINDAINWLEHHFSSSTFDIDNRKFNAQREPFPRATKHKLAWEMAMAHFTKPSKNEKVHQKKGWFSLKPPFRCFLVALMLKSLSIKLSLKLKILRKNECNRISLQSISKIQIRIRMMQFWMSLSFLLHPCAMYAFYLILFYCWPYPI